MLLHAPVARRMPLRCSLWLSVASTCTGRTIFRHCAETCCPGCEMHHPRSKEAADASPSCSGLRRGEFAASAQGGRTAVLGYECMKYRREVDGLRAVAVIPVIFYHAGLQGFGGGYVGVDVFFVISGYLITSLIHSDLGRGSFSVLSFYERRARRILPALFVMMAACIPFAFLFMRPAELDAFSGSVVAVTLFVSNIYFWSQTGYFDSAAEVKPLLHTWSLGVEEQFYLLFPLAMLVLWRFARSRLFLLFLLAAVVSLAFSEWGWRNSPNGNFFFTPTRAWELLAGALCALWLKGGDGWRNDFLAGLGLGAIAIAVVGFSDATPIPSVYGLVPVGGAVLVILFAGTGTGVARLLSTRIFVGIGLVSYSAYLWHMPLMAFARLYNLHAPSTSVLVGLALASFPIAYLSWRFVEQPCRRPGFPLPSRQAAFSASALGIAVFVGLGSYGYMYGGLQTRLGLTPLQKSYLETATGSERAQACMASIQSMISPEEACVHGEGEPTLAVLGDSHSNELAERLAANLAPSNISVKHFSFGACYPGITTMWRDGSAGVAACRRWMEQVLDWLIAHPEIEEVVLSYRLYANMQGAHEAVYPDLPVPDDPERPDRILNQLSAFLDTLSRHKKVVLVLQAPGLPAHIERLIYRRDLAGETIAGVPTEWWRERKVYFETNRDRIPSSLKIFDPTPLFCDDTTCAAGRDGQAYYFDHHHLSLAGADLVARALLPHLDSARPDHVREMSQQDGQGAL